MSFFRFIIVSVSFCALHPLISLFELPEEMTGFGYIEHTKLYYVAYEFFVWMLEPSKESETQYKGISILMFGCHRKHKWKKMKQSKLFENLSTFELFISI